MTLFALRDDRDLSDVPYPERFDDLPCNVMDALWEYERKHSRPFAFVVALLENDLSAAIVAGDDYNLDYLVPVVQMMRAELRADCWGSKSAVEAWLRGKR